MTAALANSPVMRGNELSARAFYSTSHLLLDDALSRCQRLMEQRAYAGQFSDNRRATRRSSRSVAN